MSGSHDRRQIMTRRDHLQSQLGLLGGDARSLLPHQFGARLSGAKRDAVSFQLTHDVAAGVRVASECSSDRLCRHPFLDVHPFKFGSRVTPFSFADSNRSECPLQGVALPRGRKTDQLVEACRVRCSVDPNRPMRESVICWPRERRRKPDFQAPKAALKHVDQSPIGIGQRDIYVWHSVVPHGLDVNRTLPIVEATKPSAEVS